MNGYSYILEIKSNIGYNRDNILNEMNFRLTRTCMGMLLLLSEWGYYVLRRTAKVPSRLYFA